MSSITRFEDLHAWQSARQLANLVYDLTTEGQFASDFGLKDQIRRAAVSVMSNIAEGFESHTQSLFVNYLGRAKASAGEVRSQLYLAFDRGYLAESQFTCALELADKTSRQIYRFIQYLQSQPNALRVKEDRNEYAFNV